MDTEIHRDEIFSENRDNLFVARLCNDLAKLESIGMNYNDIKHTIGTFNYVKVWTRTPAWLYPKLKLPAGHKWQNGIKAGKLYMLVIGDDLWLKPVAIPGTHKDDPKIGMVKDFRKVAARDVASCLGIPFDTAILDFFKSQGLYLGYTVPVLKSAEQAKQMLVDSIMHCYRYQHDWNVFSEDGWCV